MRVVHPTPRSTSPNRSGSSQSSAPVLHELGVEHHELLAQDNAVGRVVVADVPVDLAEESRRIVPVPLPAVKQVFSLYRRSDPTHGLATIRTEASLLFELASVLSESVRCALGSVKKLCCCGSTDVLADERKNNSKLPASVITRLYPEVSM